MSLLPHVEDFRLLPRASSVYSRNWLVDDDFWRPIVGVPSPLWNWDYKDYLRHVNAALQNTGAQVSLDKNKFNANIDVQHFKPEEISVKVQGDTNTVTVEGKHEEKNDEHGQIFRHFVRKYALPKDCDINKVESKLSSDGVLNISAQRVGQNEQQIPITKTGEPVRIIKKESGEEKK